MCDRDTKGSPSVFKVIRSAAALARILSIFDFSWEETSHDGSELVGGQFAFFELRKPVVKRKRKREKKKRYFFLPYIWVVVSNVFVCLYVLCTYNVHADSLQSKSICTSHKTDHLPTRLTRVRSFCLKISLCPL